MSRCRRGKAASVVPIRGGTRLTVRKLRYDGSLVWDMPGVLVEQAGTRLVVEHPVGTEVVRGNEVLWTITSAPTVSHMWLDRWYLIYEGISPDGRRFLFGNVQTPIRIQECAFSYVDLDLDVVRIGDGPPALEDVEEFLERGARHAYPPEIVDGAWQATAELLMLLSTDEPLGFTAPHECEVHA